MNLNGNSEPSKKQSQIDWWSYVVGHDKKTSNKWIGSEIWKSERISQLIGNIFPCLATKQSPDEMIRARPRSATLRAHSMGLRNYPSMASLIPSQVGRTHFHPFSEWKAESAWPGARSGSNPRLRNASPRTCHLTRTPDSQVTGVQDPNGHEERSEMY